MKRIKIGLRSKVVLLASFLLVLPWLGYHYIWEMESFLRQGQQQTLIGTTRAVATALHERPNLFNTQASFLPEVEAGKDLYAYDIDHPIQIDGLLTDWDANQNQSRFYGKEYIRFQANQNTTNPISFKHMVGKRDGYLYGYFQVTNKTPVLRRENSLRVDKNDHLIMALTSPEGTLQHYIISVFKSGWFNAYAIPANQYNPIELIREKRIQGYWRLTETGYNIEFRLPLTLLGDKLGFELHTVADTESRQTDTIISTSNIQDINQLGTVLVPSPEIEQILKGLGHSNSRIWVVDRHQRVLAKTGDIRQANGVWGAEEATTKDSLSIWNHIQETLLTPIYQLFLERPRSDFIDSIRYSTQLNSEFIDAALTGKSQSNWSATEDNKAMILSAASPIYVGDKIMGVVVAQETTNGIRALRNKALEKLFNVLLAIISIATILLLIFASRIASRIRTLRDQADHAIDDQGRILTPFTPSNSTDEIGDLSRGLSDMVNRLGQYHTYLENLSSRLSHELRTPVAVIRSSLENLALLPQNSENQKYITRAEQGIHRLNRILTSMSEATRLEQSLQSSDKQQFPLNELIEGCVQGYQMTYVDYQFHLTNSPSSLLINADPDFIVQLLDKLIGNAMEFSDAQHPIELSVTKNGDYAAFSVSNLGPLLPNNMTDELLKSMVSVRAQSKESSSHLGLGLFIAKMICDYHQGKISITNRDDKRGVLVTVNIPLIH